MFRQGLAASSPLYEGVEVAAGLPNDAEALRPGPRALSRRGHHAGADALREGRCRRLEAMRSFPDPPKVVIVTMFESPRYVRELTGVGASAHLLKTASAEHLVAAVRTRRCLRPRERKNAAVGMPPRDAPGAAQDGRG